LAVLWLRSIIVRTNARWPRRPLADAECSLSSGAANTFAAGGWLESGNFQLNKCRKRLRHAGVGYSIQLHRCLKISKKGTPMKSTKRALKAAVLAAMLAAVMLLSSGCITPCGTETCISIGMGPAAPVANTQ
jgi:hypothetical protein